MVRPFNIFLVFVHSANNPRCMLTRERKQVRVYPGRPLESTR